MPINMRDGRAARDFGCRRSPPQAVPSPQPGIEMWNTIQPASDSQAFATDLNGNVIWTYSYSHSSNDYIQGIQLLPNGNLLMVDLVPLVA